MLYILSNILLLYIIEMNELFKKKKQKTSVLLCYNILKIIDF